MNNYNLIIQPIISEKTNNQISEKVYVFKVAKNANKIEIKKNLEQEYDIKIKKINTINTAGKYKRRGKTHGYTSEYKKAVIILHKDSKTIPIFDSLT